MLYTRKVWRQRGKSEALNRRRDEDIMAKTKRPKCQ
jgi:hypothetical protein